MSLVFYDIETTGISSSFDQILQFAAIKTDTNFTEVDQLNIRCRLRDHIIPSPDALRVTGISVSQLHDPVIPSHYEMIRRINKKLLSWSPAIFLGFNSLNFDEHFFRQALYQTLHRPYLTNTNGNARTDVMKMVQAASIFAPDALIVPRDIHGNTSFRLGPIASANGYVHDQLHDALSDAKATMFLCRLLSERTPWLWSTFMRFSQKAAVIDFIKSESFFCLTDFYFGNPYSWMVTVIGENQENSSEYYVFDLSVNPDKLKVLSQDMLRARVNDSPKPLRRLRVNAAPIIVSAEEAPEICSAHIVGFDEISRREHILKSDDELKNRIIEAFESTREKRNQSPYVEEQIYDGFFTIKDETLLNDFQNVEWEKRREILQKFNDSRLIELGLRLIYEERPDLLSETEHHDIENKFFHRHFPHEGDVFPWLTVQKALVQLNTLLSSTEIENKTNLEEYRRILLMMTEKSSD